MTRINGTDDTASMLSKMSDGNPGALSALMNMMECGREVDPNDFMGGMSPILGLDTLGIYGTDIYILWSDQCHKDTREFLMLLRANQFGFVSDERIKAVAGDQMNRIRFTQEEMDDFNTKVCKELPNFQKRKK